MTSLCALSSASRRFFSCGCSGAKGVKEVNDDNSSSQGRFPVLLQNQHMNATARFLATGVAQKAPFHRKERVLVLLGFRTLRLKSCTSTPSHFEVGDMSLMSVGDETLSRLLKCVPVAFVTCLRP